MIKYYYIYFVVLILFCASCSEKKTVMTQNNTSDTTCVVKYKSTDSYDWAFTLIVNNYKTYPYAKIEEKYDGTDLKEHKSRWTPELIKAATMISYGYINPPYNIELHEQKQVDFYESDTVSGIKKLYLIDLIYLDTITRIGAFVDISRRQSIDYFNYQDYFIISVEKNSDKAFFARLDAEDGYLYLNILNVNSYDDNSIMNTKNICDSISAASKGIPIQFPNTNGCLQIKNNKLDYQNIDLNNDGLLDIRFSGWRMQYCPEKHWDLASRTEQDTLIDSIPIIVDFIAYQNRAKQYRWRYVDRNCGTKLTTKY